MESVDEIASVLKRDKNMDFLKGSIFDLSLGPAHMAEIAQILNPNHSMSFTFAAIYSKLFMIFIWFSQKLYPPKFLI
ncbi:MAG: hypothetical protein AB9879_05635 [Methanothrix sp.]